MCLSNAVVVVLGRLFVSARLMNSKFNGMPNWTLSVERCPATKGFVGLDVMPKSSATTPKKEPKQEQEKKE